MDVFIQRREAVVGTAIRGALGGILRRSEPLGRIYGWIPIGDLLGFVARVPYLEELYMEKETENQISTGIALKRLRMP